MKITRNAAEYGLPDKIIEIELNSEELEQAFRIKEREHKLEDVKNIINDAFENEDIYEEEYRRIKDNKKFYEAVLRKFEKDFSTHIPEIVMWRLALMAILRKE